VTAAQESIDLALGHRDLRALLDPMAHVLGHDRPSSIDDEL
jgi:hypothetical protein